MPSKEFFEAAEQLLKEKRFEVDAGSERDGPRVESITLEELINTHPIISQAYHAGRQEIIQQIEEGNEAYTLEDHLKAALVLLGLDPTNQHFSDTPKRVAKVLRSYVQPVDLDEVLSSGFEDDPSEEDGGHEKNLVVQAPIPFFGFCAHHLLPFFGAAAIGYLPDTRVVGLSKLTRLVYAAGHISPTTQEHITNTIADALYNSRAIRPKGVAVISSALHGCMASRGVEAPDTRTFASAIRGAFATTPALEQKFMDLALLGLGNSR